MVSQHIYGTESCLPEGTYLHTFCSPGNGRQNFGLIFGRMILEQKDFFVFIFKLAHGFFVVQSAFKF